MVDSQINEDVSANGCIHDLKTSVTSIRHRVHRVATNVQ